MDAIIDIDAFVDKLSIAAKAQVGANTGFHSQARELLIVTSLDKYLIALADMYLGCQFICF